ncbi:VTC domain protein [Planctomycetes bacterium Pla163]|uniref:VTC domain protein n=1 Tax=Rohdeia mirabilis TaxID=2528008 RepID=A0A518CZM1_9BACT|nr:VTC domain protein [Planctomycetes bacterium Pla163]
MASDTGHRDPNALRYEIKMACQESAYPRVLAAMRLHPAAVRTLYPPRRVQSVYLDTPDGNALEENLAGISHREKLRFRWYGDGATGVRGTLERKVRENLLGWKDLARIDAEVDVEGTDRLTFMRHLIANVPADWAADLRQGLEPVQWISYTRDYFTTADGTVRITVDRELRTWDQRLRWRLSRAQSSFIDRILVIEAKCATQHYERARELLNHLPLFVDRCSKFVLASSAPDGPHPSIFPE